VNVDVDELSVRHRRAQAGYDACLQIPEHGFAPSWLQLTQVPVNPR
jgi:hypothetical protein